MPIDCGYNNITLIRKPFKRLEEVTDNSTALRSEKIGDFNLIPIDGYYNTESRIFPDDNDINDGDVWKIYIISDPDVGVLIPHIKKDSNKFVVPYKNIDLDILANKTQINTFISEYKESVANNLLSNPEFANTLTYSVSDFIFIQPIFLRVGTDNNYTWYVYAPKYKINDDDVEFEKRELSNFSDIFDTNSNKQINDVVISTQPVENINFSQFAIGRNGISMKNGLSYTVSNTGDVNFNIGNIKSDTTPFMKTKVSLNGTLSMFNKKLETESYKKGDVISGTSITSLLNTILQDMYLNYSPNLSICSVGTDQSIKTVTISSASIPLDGIIVYLKNGNTVQSPTFAYYAGRGTTPTREFPIVYEGNSGTDLTIIPSGYYRVTPIFDNNDNQTGWQFKKDALYSKLDMLLKKTSKFDILLVKK